MNSKEKAKELVDKFYPRATSFSSDRKNQNDNAKECALIAVDELLNHCYEVMKPFWMEVKEEINKL